MNQNHTTLIEAEQAQAHLGDPNWRFLDCQFDLMDAQAGRANYLNAHIPGAVFVDLNEDISSPITSNSGRHPLPDIPTLATKLGRWGIDSDTQVIAYDGAGGVAASRLWWVLRWLGHSNVAVLNGGLAHWRQLGFAVTGELPSTPEKTFTPNVQTQMLVTTQDILTTQQQSDVLQNDVSQHKELQNNVLLDARAAQRYRGEQEPIDPVAGHIPGALNYFQGDNLQASGLFKNKEELQQQISQVIGSTQPQQIIHYCGSGVSACHNLLAMEYIGMKGSTLYPGSWSEWIRDPQRPIATGA